MEAVEHTLLRLLRLSQKEADCWPLFYRVLKNMQVYVIGAISGPYREYIPLGPESTLSISTIKNADGSAWIPFFSTEEAMRVAQDIQLPYLKMPVHLLLEKTRGARLVLNPASESKKEFLPDEVDRILGARYEPINYSKGYRENAQVILGLPDVYPSGLVDALTALFINSPAVVCAYFCAAHDIGFDESPTLIIGVQVDRPALDDLVSAAHIIVAETKEPGESVSLRILEYSSAARGSIEHYLFTQCEPFYRRYWGRQLRGSTVVGHS